MVPIAPKRGEERKKEAEIKERFLTVFPLFFPSPFLKWLWFIT